MFPLVKINDYIYTRNLYRARTYQNGSPQMSEKVPYNEKNQNAFSVFSRYDDETRNVDWYMVSNYTNNLNRWGGFAPQGWTVPYTSQYQKMIDNIANIPGKKPDGTIGASFLKNGVYGFNTQATGFVGLGFNTDDEGKYDKCYHCNEDILYLGSICDDDKEKLDGTGNVYGKRDDLQTMFRCDALAVEPSTGNAAMSWFLDQIIVYQKGNQITDSHFYPESVRNRGNWGTYRNSTKNVIEHAIYVYKNSKSDNAGYKMCFPIIICQKVVK